ncbi:mitochondrial cytochrome-like protein b2 [Truncatella angustata]|uniref:Mitochondrial cytochrome-like protein b2 n=1 Tax=Truncatella angustata TaxID=152316 RepID=A0A9P8UE34_9PEZI|nr:mitochondrial cytochrome-like protein b2 [Truncatella angustata]KAH6648253.1 mitochondrial cytochrome-like protein b2 [Truncatella angustata]
MDGTEVAKRNTSDSCWIVLNAEVYDVTSYLEQHPGGAAIILAQGGKDATAEFSRIHSPDILQYLPDGSRLGPIDEKTLGALKPPRDELTTIPSGKEDKVPHLSGCVVTTDFEHAAKTVLPARSWSYVSSYSNSGLSMAGNLDSWSSVRFRPRVLRNVEKVSTETSILGHASPLPFYVSPMGLLGRAHEDAELGLVKGLVRSGVHGLISTMSTRPTEDVAGALDDELKQARGISRDFPSSSQLHFQLYTSSNRETTIKLINRVKAAGFRSLWVTVDTPILGKRTIDRRQMAEEALALGSEQQASTIGLGIQTHVPANRINAALEWDDLKWLKEAWGGPLVLKGIQSAEDAKLAMEYGCHGILLSNHGGRQLHSAPDALSTLVEIRQYCPEVLEHVEIFVDGGLRDGADILKALCLGAKAVGIGRPFFYALSAYGTPGVERCVDILAEELRTTMALTGITSLDQVHPNMVNASRLLSEMWRPIDVRPMKSRL